MTAAHRPPHIDRRALTLNLGHFNGAGQTDGTVIPVEVPSGPSQTADPQAYLNRKYGSLVNSKYGNLRIERPLAIGRSIGRPVPVNGRVLTSAFGQVRARINAGWQAVGSTPCQCSVIY